MYTVRFAYTLLKYGRQMSFEGVISMYEPRIEDVHKEMARWLQGVFSLSAVLTMGTFTFRNPDSSKTTGWTAPGRQYVGRVAQLLERRLESNGSSAFVCVEEGTDTRRLHLHSLSNTPKEVLRILERDHTSKHGYVGLRDVSSREGVSKYVSKYVTKSDIMFYAGGPAFAAWRLSSGVG